MKYRYIIMIFLLIGNINLTEGQSNCPPNGISTYPDNFNNPLYPDCNNVYNSFDWTEQYFNTPQYNNNNTNVVVSPFYNNNNAFLEHIAWHTQYGGPNYHPEDGWELLSENITQTAAGLDFIYFVLYNKFSSTIRVFGAFEQKNEDYNYYVIKLSFPDESNNMTALLHPSGGIGQPLDKPSINNIHTTFRNPLDESRFIMADFPVEYDPCTCLKSNDGLKVTFDLVEEQSLQLYGRLWALSGTVGNVISGTGGSFKQEDFLTSTYSNGVGLSQAGTMIYNSLEGMISKYEANAAVNAKLGKQLKALKVTKIVLDFVAKTAGKVPTPEAKVAALAANTIGQVVDYASYKVEKKQSGLQGENKAIGSMTVTQAEMSFSGSISSVQNSGIIFNMDMPGSPANDENCDEPTYPKYNEVLGRFAILETPKVEIGVSVDGAPTYFSADRSRSFRFKLDKESLKYLFNPAAGVNEDNTLVYAGLVIKGKNTVAVPGVESVPSIGYNINYASISDGLDSVTFTSQFVRLDCLGDMTTELISIDNSDDYSSDLNMFINEIYEVQLRFIIYYEFNQLDINGNPNKAFQIVTYPLEQVIVPYSNIPNPISNSNQVPIVDSIYIGTNTNYTFSQTIFAWRKVVIDANLTTSPDVEINVIAPEIIVQGGNVGQGISLNQGYFPISCTSMNQYNGDLQSFCDGSTYNAAESKHSKLVDNKTDKPQIPVAFQAYPNPFTNTFNIEFELETEGETSLVVYDALGRVVVTVLENDTLPFGKHQYKVDGTKLESGLYIATLQHSGGTQTIKIIKQ